jgi:hypothetical protein
MTMRGLRILAYVKSEEEEVDAAATSWTAAMAMGEEK